SERRAGGHRRLPATGGLCSEFPDSGALRSVQRTVDARAGDVDSADQSGEWPPLTARRPRPRHRPERRGRARSSLRPGRVLERPPRRLGETTRPGKDAVKCLRVETDHFHFQLFIFHFYWRWRVELPAPTTTGAAFERASLGVSRSPLMT